MRYPSRSLWKWKSTDPSKRPCWCNQARLTQGVGDTDRKVVPGSGDWVSGGAPRLWRVAGIATEVGTPPRNVVLLPSTGWLYVCLDRMADTGLNKRLCELVAVDFAGNCIGGPANAFPDVTGSPTAERCPCNGKAPEKVGATWMPLRHA